MKKSSLIAVLALAVAAVPASAKDHPGHDKSAQPARAEKAHKCVAHGRGYVAGGKLVSAALTKNDDGTYSGTMTITVRRANHHAGAVKGTEETYTLDHARVNLHGQDASALQPGSRASVLGKVTTLNQRCDQTGFTAATTIRKADVKAPRAEKPAEPAQPETDNEPQGTSAAA